MEKKICIQVHDYDKYGNYHIVEDREASWPEVLELKEKARESVDPDWSKLPDECTHIVYYGELMDKTGEVWFAAIFMKGEAYGEKDFEQIFNAENIGYVGAFHKRV